jgi:hypothetical protein
MYRSFIPIKIGLTSEFFLGKKKNRKNSNSKPNNFCLVGPKIPEINVHVASSRPF